MTNADFNSLFGRRNTAEQIKCLPGVSFGYVIGCKYLIEALAVEDFYQLQTWKLSYHIDIDQVGT